MRLTEVADIECCDACGEYFNAADKRGAVCPTCTGLEESKIVESCTDCGVPVEEYGNICTQCMESKVVHVKNESFSFDKFMDDIVIHEIKASNKINSDTPQRERLRRYHEKPLNRMKIR